MEENKSLIDTFKHYDFKFEKLPLELIEEDQNQPRKAFGLAKGGDHNRLLHSVQHYGIEEPIKVCEISETRYIIMDGHRRYKCAKELKFKTAPCRIYPKMSEGEFEARRFKMQNNRRSWKPIEKANSLHRIQVEFKHSTKKDIADLVGITQISLFHFEELRNTRMDYLELMSENNLKEHQRVGFTKLLPKLRKIRHFEVDDIVRILFKKINDNLLYRVNDFTMLSKIFSTATLHEEEIFRFLSEPAISVDELSEATLMSGMSTQIKNLIKELSTKRNLGIKLSEKEHSLLGDLFLLIENFR